MITNVFFLQRPNLRLFPNSTIWASMSAICGLPLLECVYCLACARWVWKKILYTAGKESENWGLAGAGEFEPVPRICRYILAVYEDDLWNPLWTPPGGYGMNPDWVILRRND
ncbi:Laminin subunit beta-2 like, partial [Actinidia chinensis var. chinensis]